MRARILASGCVATLLLLGGGTALACSTDGIPSLLVNGRLVAVNAAWNGKTPVAQWTPFVARGSYQAAHTLVFGEDHARVAASLPPIVFKYPWRWTFGDGTSAHGFSVRHTYRRPGTYIVTVIALMVGGHYKQWYPFDAATIHVR